MLEYRSSETGLAAAKKPDLEAMSNAEILQELDILLTTSAEGMDTEGIERRLALLQERDPVMEDFDTASLWDRLKEAHPLIFEEEVYDNFDAKRSHSPAQEAKQP